MARLLTLSEQREVVVHEGWTLDEAITYAVDKELQPFTMAFLNGQQCTDLTITLKQSDSLLLAVVPQGGGGGGGKNILGAILTVAVIIAAVVLAAPTGGASLWLAGATGMSATTAGLVIGAGVSLLGTLAISALIPPPTTNTGDVGTYGGETVSPTYSLSGQSNQVHKYGAVLKVYGTHKVFPTLAANPLITNLGSESRISALYDFGLGDVEVKDLKIGDADASTFAPEFEWHKNSLVTSTKFMNRRVGYDQFSYLLKQSQELIIRTKTNTVEFDMDLSFNRGLVHFNDRGNPTTTSVGLTIQYRPVGTTTWLQVLADHIRGASASTDTSTVIVAHHPAVTNPDGSITPEWDETRQDPTGAVTIGGSSSKPFVAVATVGGLTPGQYEIRIVRNSAESTDNRTYSDVAVTLIKSYQDGKIVELERKHTMLEMRVLASEKLSGTVQNLSGIATSVLRYTADNGATFATKATNNPAWIAIDILTGSGNSKALSDDHIDWVLWQKLADFCDRKGYTANFVVDYPTTVQELLNSVLSSCRAALMITTAGKYGVLIDEEKTVPRQLITPANSWSFSGVRAFSDIPHAFRVSFINPDLNWQRDERMVYFDGYDETNATKFETLNTFGITDKDQAWKYGRYMMAQGIHRSETFNVTMDVENLVVQRGDLVHVANDMIKVGGMPCRIVSASGNTITVDTDLGTLPTGYSARQNDGTVRTGRVLSAASTNTFTLDSVAGIDGDCLIVLGVMDRVVQPYLVQAIVPGNDLTAELSLVKYVKEVYTADTGTIPPWNPGFGDDLINKTDLVVTGLTATQKIIYINRMPQAQIELKWAINGFGYDKSDIYMSVNGQPGQFIGDTQSIKYEQLIDLINQPQYVNQSVTFEVIPQNTSGVQGKSDKVTIIPRPDTAKPKLPEGFGVNIQSETIVIFWSKSDEEDIDHYEIRYSPDITGVQWNQSQHLATVSYETTRTSAGARTGTYMLRAYDTSGNVSDIVSQRTTVATLPNVNEIHDIDDRATGWGGIRTNLEALATTKDLYMKDWTTLASVHYLSEKLANVTDLHSQGTWGQVLPEGTYTFKDTIDLGDVYEVRVSSKIKVYGYNQAGDVVSNDLWDAWLEYRVVGQARFMKDWATLAGEPDLIGSGGLWSEWRIINVGDITGKLVQFRIQIRSKDPSIKVAITDGSVIIDAVDRMWSKNDIILTAGANRVNFDPAYMFDNVSVAISIDGNNQPLVANVTSKTRSGFNVELVDTITHLPAAGKIDVVARGQGQLRTASI